LTSLGKKRFFLRRAFLFLLTSRSIAERKGFFFFYQKGDRPFPFPPPFPFYFENGLSCAQSFAEDDVLLTILFFLSYPYFFKFFLLAWEIVLPGCASFLIEPPLLSFFLRLWETRPGSSLPPTRAMMAYRWTDTLLIDTSLFFSTQRFRVRREYFPFVRVHRHAYFFSPPQFTALGSPS